MSEILVHPEKCTGCLTCQLRCSFTFTGVFNPFKARIEIIQALATKEGVYKIRFTDDCVYCGVCAEHCAYGALELIG